VVRLDRWQSLTATEPHTFAPLCPGLVVELASQTDEGLRLPALAVCCLLPNKLVSHLFLLRLIMISSACSIRCQIHACGVTYAFPVRLPEPAGSRALIGRCRSNKRRSTSRRSGRAASGLWRCSPPRPPAGAHGNYMPLEEILSIAGRCGACMRVGSGSYLSLTVVLETVGLIGLVAQ